MGVLEILNALIAWLEHLLFVTHFNCWKVSNYSVIFIHL